MSMKRQLIIVITTPEIDDSVAVAPYFDLALRSYLQGLSTRCLGQGASEAFKMPSGLSLVATHTVLGQEHAD